jgi:uncharacterized protein
MDPHLLLQNTLALFLDAAPWLLFGLLAAGLIKAWVPQEAMSRWLGGRGPWPVTKAALLGAPLPLCSCGVLPAALGLRRAGASKGATVSFLIATPETGVDSIAVSYALLGPFMAVVRPIAAVLNAIFAGLLAALVPEAPAAVPAPRAAASCGCADACAAPAPRPAAQPGALPRAVAGMRYAMTDVLDDIAPWLAFGLLLAGVVATAVPPMALAAWGSGLPAMLVMLLVGVPMYICATASTPFAAALLLAGVSPGTVLVFLLAGPATNVATLGIVRRELGNGVFLTYLAGIALGSIGLGLATDVAVERLGIDIVAQLAEVGEFVPTWLAAASALVLTVFAVRPVRRLLLRDRVAT